MGNGQSAENIAKFKAASLPCTRYEAGYEGLVFCDGQCQQLSTVWGIGPYVAESCACRAARHAGVIPSTGAGCFKVVTRPGQEAYEGSTAHGVSSYTCGPTARAIVIEKAH